MYTACTDVFVFLLFFTNSIRQTTVQNMLRPMGKYKGQQNKQIFNWILEREELFIEPLIFTTLWGYRIITKTGKKQK